VIRPECNTCEFHHEPDWCSSISHGMGCKFSRPGEVLWIKPGEEMRYFPGRSTFNLERKVITMQTYTLPTDAKNRKAVPIFSGVLRYFPDAIAAVAACSQAGNDQHHPGEPLHWDRSKSTDELDALTRHLVEAGTLDTDGVRHSAKVAWRALANLQKEIEKERTAQSVAAAGLDDEAQALTFGEMAGSVE
jgi:hypothetical protein